LALERPGGPAVSFQAVFAAAALGCAVLMAAPPACAQHVVTNTEAGKLTFDALTATPRPIYRPIVAFRHIHRGAYISRVSYRRRAGFHSKWR